MIGDGVAQGEELMGADCWREGPEAAPSGAGFLLEKDAAARDDESAGLLHVDHARAGAFDGERFGRFGGAAAADGAVAAAGAAREADEGAELHEGGIEAAGAARGLEAGGKGVECGCPAGGVGRRLKIEEAGEDAGDIRIDGGHGLVEREGGDGSGGVGSDAGQGADGGRIGGEMASVIRDDGSGGAMEIAGAGVIAEALPCMEDVRPGSGGEGLERREESHPAVKVGDHRCDLGLLEHDLRDQNRIRVPRGAPGEIASVAGEPAAECGSKKLVIPAGE